MHLFKLVMNCAQFRKTRVDLRVAFKIDLTERQCASGLRVPPGRYPAGGCEKLGCTRCLAPRPAGKQYVFVTRVWGKCTVIGHERVTGLITQNKRTSGSLCLLMRGEAMHQGAVWTSCVGGGSVIFTEAFNPRPKRQCIFRSL